MSNEALSKEDEQFVEGFVSQMCRNLEYHNKMVQSMVDNSEFLSEFGGQPIKLGKKKFNPTKI